MLEETRPYLKIEAGPVALRFSFSATHEGVHDVIHVLDEREFESILRRNLVFIHLMTEHTRAALWKPMGSCLESRGWAEKTTNLVKPSHQLHAF